MGAVLLTLTLVGGAASAEPSSEPARLRGASSRPTLESQKPTRFKAAFDRGAKALVLNFFALDCGPCRAELPEVEALAARGGVEVYVVAITRPASDADRTCAGQDELLRYFRDEHPRLLPRVLFDDCGGLLKTLGKSDAQDLPVTYVFGPKLESTFVLRGRAPKGQTLGDALGPALDRLVGR
jgi:thiol-disulfide isomerase/thioredoxin